MRTPHRRTVSCHGPGQGSACTMPTGPQAVSRVMASGSASGSASRQRLAPAPALLGPALSQVPPRAPVVAPERAGVHAATLRAAAGVGVRLAERGEHHRLVVAERRGMDAAALEPRQRLVALAPPVDEVADAQQAVSRRVEAAGVERPLERPEHPVDVACDAVPAVAVRPDVQVVPAGLLGAGGRSRAPAGRTSSVLREDAAPSATSWITSTASPGRSRTNTSPRSAATERACGTQAALTATNGARANARAMTDSSSRSTPTT